MAATITKEEYECVRCQAMTSFADKAYEMLLKENYTFRPSVKDIRALKKLFVLMSAIWTWEQSEFDYIPYSNFINDYEFQAIFSKIRETI